MSLYEELRTNILARDERNGWKRIRTQLENWPDAKIATMAEVAIGAQVITDRSSKTRYVDRDAWNAPGFGVTNAELAREYLAHCRHLYGFTENADPRARKCIPYKRWEIDLLESLCAPLYYEGEAHEGEWALMDLEACYASLYLPVGAAPSVIALEGDFGFATSEISFDRAEEWKEHKGPRNALVGVCGLHGPLTVYRYGVPVEVERVFNPGFSPGLVNWCLFFANAIAREMIERFGFVAWATDGGICPAVVAREAASYAKSAWGMELRTKAIGVGTVWHATSYRIGDYETDQETKVRGVAYRHLLPLDPGPFREARQALAA